MIVATYEEHAVLQATGWRLVRQTMVPCGNAPCDKLEVRSAASDETATFYFEISRPTAWLRRTLGGEPEGR